MKSGVVGSVAGDFSKISSSVSEYEREGIELKSCIEILDEFQLSGGLTAQVGQAARQVPDSEETWVIEEEAISSRERKFTKTEYTTFLSISGEIIIVGSGSGSFAFDLIGRDTETVIERANLSLGEFYRQHQEADYWQAGFYGKDSDAENGAIYGSNVFSDSDLGGVLEITELNQLGAQYAYGNNLIKLTLTESGYIDVYNPDFDAKEFLIYFESEILPIVRTR